MKNNIRKMPEFNSDVKSGQELCDNSKIVCPDVLCDDISDCDVLDAYIMKTYLKTQWFGSEIVVYDEIDSTNDELKRLGNISPKHGMLAVAECQTKGKGRLGRNWMSKKGTGVWMSFMVCPPLAPKETAPITLVAAMACCRAVKAITGLNAQIKWPNDLIINGKKIVGILTELSADMKYVVVGVGINVNIPNFPDDLADKASSLYSESKTFISRNQLIGEFGNYFEKYYSIFVHDRNMSGLKSEYEKLMVNLNKEVRILGNTDVEDTGIALGINDDGELLVRREKGDIITVRAGEVSVRGIYGYV